MVLGLALAYLGEKSAAIREGQRGTTLVPIMRDAYAGADHQHQLVRIYLLVGEPEKALEQLEPLLKIPYTLYRLAQKLDLTSIRPRGGNPRFQRLVEGT